MLTSANGWVVLSGRTDGDLPRLRRWQLPDTDLRVVLRDGSAGFLLLHLALWFHENVEDVVDGQRDDWGYASRTIRGSTTISNHSSGTALDLNALQHPMGSPTLETFTRKQVVQVHRRLQLYDGCIRWGGDYQRRPDSMHWELRRGLATCERTARRLVGSPRGHRILEANPGAGKVILL